MATFKIKSPISEDTVKKLKVGTKVLITGVICVARDAAHKRLVEALDKKEKLPFDIKGQTIFYMGPSPARPGQVIGAAGPTTSARMDGFTPRLLESGLRAMIGKGERSQAVMDAIKKYNGIYFVAAGGAGALLPKQLRSLSLSPIPTSVPKQSSGLRSRTSRRLSPMTFTAGTYSRKRRRSTAGWAFRREHGRLHF